MTSLRMSVTSLVGDREYYSRLLKFAIPIALQQFIFASLNLISNLMIGQLGDTAIAGVALANQIFFLLNLFIFGIASGAAMFTAQLWGKRDISNIHKVLGLTLLLGIGVGTLFWAISVVIPESILRIYSNDDQVIALGSSFLEIFGWSFLFFSITITYAAVLRSIGEIRLPVIVTISALILNVFLSYGLIFGRLGLPELGVNGAAVSLLIARIYECLALIVLTYRLRLPLAARISELTSFNWKFAAIVLRPVLPVAINEILWSLGITAYTVIYGRMSTEALASFNISSTIDGLAIVPFIGIANATAILVGNLIGQEQDERAQRYGGSSLLLAFLGAVFTGVLIILFSPVIISLYKVSPSVIINSTLLLRTVAAFLWLRMMNLILFIGIFRAGGDTRYALVLDGLIIWILGVPLATVGAFYLHLPVYLVYLLTMSEELTKWGLGLWRYISRRWIHHLAHSVEIHSE